jgi:hypothetical protein
VPVACGLVVKIFWAQAREKPWSFLLLRWLSDLPPKLWITHTSVPSLASRGNRRGIDVTRAQGELLIVAIPWNARFMKDQSNLG